MESDHFDALTRRFVSRRAGIGLALAGVLSQALPADAKKKKKKKCKTPCGLCETCKKGKCTPLPGLKQCGSACIAADSCCTDGSPGCPAGRTCTSGTCAGCTGTGQPCTDSNACCMGFC